MSDELSGCARPLSVERDGAVNAKDNPPTTDDGTRKCDLTDRQPANAASLLLSAAERERFAAWLEADAAVDEGMAEQSRKLPGAVGAALAAEREKDCAAKRRIAHQLRSTEDVSV